MPQKTTPDQLEFKGKKAFSGGDYLAAAQIFSEAARISSKAGDPLKAAEMRSNQSVALLRAKQPEKALEIILGVCDIFNQSKDLHRRGIALGNKAAVLSSLKKRDEAITCYREAADLLEQAGEDEDRLIVMRQAASLYAVRLKFVDALLTVREGYLGLKKPTLMQKVVKKLLFVGS